MEGQWQDEAWPSIEQCLWAPLLHPFFVTPIREVLGFHRNFHHKQWYGNNCVGTESMIEFPTNDCRNKQMRDKLRWADTRRRPGRRQQHPKKERQLRRPRRCSSRRRAINATPAHLNPLGSVAVREQQQQPVSRLHLWRARSVSRRSVEMHTIARENLQHFLYAYKESPKEPGLRLIHDAKRSQAQRKDREHQHALKHLRGAVLTDELISAVD
ncbi:hypothetical protein ANCCAN_22839 [Ancylostoma caninum]|uniref:Uncharacterized protein n=1 Tax=Ancylostoma caninum TaxID=29170 RepID=A0A368FMG7_ANCCA|nr:hypothetical protein ANCCAN_22839 [Ancylostoma caninum]